MNNLRGQVRRALINCVDRSVTAHQVMARVRNKFGGIEWQYPSRNLNTKDRVQLAAVLRRKTPWAKDMCKQARAACL